MSHREALLETMAQLLWRRGYENTSPKAVLAESGAGQGSMYHHFKGKKDLAIQALGRHEAELLTATEGLLGKRPDRAPLQQVRDWLDADRDALAGCRLGRLANEETVQQDSELRAPLERYLGRLHTLLTDRLTEAVDDGSLRYRGEPDALASALVAVVQGGFVLARATRDADHLSAATAAAGRLLDG